MNIKLATTQIRMTEWAAIIKDCKSSGMKVDDYCQLHDISRDAYYYWLRKVKTAALQQAGFVELPLPEAKAVPGTDFATQLVSNMYICAPDTPIFERVSKGLSLSYLLHSDWIPQTPVPSFFSVAAGMTASKHFYMKVTVGFCVISVSLTESFGGPAVHRKQKNLPHSSIGG